MAQHHELYRYCAPGQRSEKYAPSAQRRQQVRYLPGLEIRICTSPTPQSSRLHVIAAGHSHLYRTNQTFSHFSLGSITGVVNEAGQWINRECFYPFGGTACCLSGVTPHRETYSFIFTPFTPANTCLIAASICSTASLGKRTNS